MDWIDTHAHLNDKLFDGRVAEVVRQAAAAGVSQILVVGIDLASSRRAVELAAEHQALFAVVGLQPNGLTEAAPGDFDEIARLARSPKVVAVGETGVDRYWDRTPMDVQQDFFRRHLQLARALDMPVVIHCRDAEWDAVETLRDFHAEGRPIAGVMHSYTGGREACAEFLRMGLYVSFAGMATYKKNDDLRATAATVPLDRLLVETDSPYLAPEPHRGKFPNTPANAIHTGACLAMVHRVSTADLAAHTAANARRLFRLPTPA
jgi:TatD DNase family protein